MQKIFFLLCCIMLSFTLHAQKHNLFNGKDLSGWTIHGTEKWYVDAGELVCESGPDKQYGYLSTQKQYKNFILTLSFKPEADGNSGVFIRSGIEGTKISGWQVEVAPPGHNSGGIYESYGRGWLIKPKDEDQQLVKMGSWNTMRIKVQGDVVSSWINGKIVIDGFRDEKIGKGEGFIALQIHDGGGIKIRWKDLVIEELPVQ